MFTTPKSPPSPIEVKSASNLVEANTENGLKVRSCVMIKGRVFFSPKGSSASRNRGPIVLLDTPEGYFLVEIDQHDLPRRTKNCILKYGTLYFSDGTKVTRDGRKERFKKNQKKVGEQHPQT